MPWSSLLPEKHLHEFRRFTGCRRDIEQFSHFARVGGQAWRGHRRRHHTRITGAVHLAPKIGDLRVRGQFAGEAIVEMTCVEHQKNTALGSIFSTRRNQLGNFTIKPQKEFSA